MERLFSALRERVREAATVFENARVTAVRREDAAWAVERAGGREPLRFDAAVLALPAFAAAELLRGLDDALGATLSSIPYASSAIVVTGHRLCDVAHPLDAFGLVIPTVERCDVLAVSFASRKFPDRAPEGRVQLRTFVGGATRPEMAAAPDGEITATVLRELKSLLGVAATPDFVHVARHDRAMPQYHLGHLELVRRIEESVSRHPGLELTGSAYRGVGIPDVIADAERAAEATFTAGRARP